MTADSPTSTTSSSQADAARDGSVCLAVVGIDKSFGGIHALADCSLVVKKGSITALIGPNGSGKTTLFNCITGFYQPDRGQVLLHGVPITGRRPSDIVHHGLMRTFQVTRIFRRMTVLENMIVPIRQLTFRSLFTAAIKGHERERAEALLEFVGLHLLRHEQAGSLSFGQQKLLELAAALMAEPEIVMLDEPAGGLNPVMIDKVAGHVRDLNQRGVTFLIIEHNMGFVMSLCDPVIVMHRGTVIAHGSPAAVREDPFVLDAYLGD
jgi:branched-chain amino acid transport system ATP-binding protein/branched-chain amino acid transport system permease protein